MVRRRVLDLLAERRDPRVAGEGEEQQPGGLAARPQRAAGYSRAPRTGRPSGCGPGAPATATKTSVASTTASRIRVSQAVRVMPSRLTPVSTTTAATATGVA